MEESAGKTETKGILSSKSEKSEKQKRNPSEITALTSVQPYHFSPWPL